MSSVLLLLVLLKKEGKKERKRERKKEYKLLKNSRGTSLIFTRFSQDF
jgi:hypothetical protein